jgi:nicotinamide mononucleotide transporter
LTIDRGISIPELIAVLLGIVYLLLAARRSRLCWIAGGCSAALLAVLAARAALPMQAALNVFYVGMSVYGFVRWGRTEAERRIEVWPLKFHVAAWSAIAIVSLGSAHLLRADTTAAWPFLDSLTTWASLFVTWLVARMKLENWILWIAVDAVLAFLFAAQHLYGFALLSVLYIGICVGGFRSWRHIYRSQRP